MQSKYLAHINYSIVDNLVDYIYRGRKADDDQCHLRSKFSSPV